MKLVCLDMENVVWPEIWPVIAEHVNIPELAQTTRDFKDIRDLFDMRIGHLRRNKVKLETVLEAVRTVEPMPGALDFVTELQKHCQFIFLSDTFEEFALCFRQKLNFQTIVCNTFQLDDDGVVVGYQLRCNETKLSTIKRLHEVGVKIVCAGDSHNDIGMIKEVEKGFLFNTTDAIKEEYPEIQAFDKYEELLPAMIKAYDEL